MLVKIKLLKRYGGFFPGDICEIEDEHVEKLIAEGIAERYDPEAERKAEENRLAERQEIVKLAVDAIKDVIKAESKDGKVPILGPVKDRNEPTAGFKSLGEFAIKVKGYQDGDRQDKTLMSWLIKAAETGLTEGVDSDGGFLVPEEFSRELLTKTYENAALVGRCRDIPMVTKSIKIPYVKETSRADGSRQGGIRAYRANELGAVSASKPTFGQIRLEVEKLYVYVAASDELLDDAAAMGSMINSAAADELAFKMDDEVINGTGAGMPLGILAAPCLVSVDKETGQAATTIEAANIMKMWSRMWGRSRPNAVWVINQDIEPQLFQMGLAVGTGGIPVYMPANGLSQSPFGTLMGRPVIPCESTATLGTVGDILLCDFTQYLYGRHVTGVEAATSIHLKFDYDQTVFRFTIRCDGQPWWPAALTPKSASSNTLSPFVGLATRS